MANHGIWFDWHAYDQGLFSDALWNISILPGASFRSKQGLLLPPRLLNTTDPSFTFPLVLVIPVTGLLLASEIKNSIRNPATYQMFYPRSNHRGSSHPETAVSDMPTQRLSLGSRVLSRLNTVYMRFKRLYRLLRQISGLPPHGRSGVRLITPLMLEIASMSLLCSLLTNIPLPN